MQIINLEEKLQKELANFDKTKPYRFFFIDYGQPSQMGLCPKPQFPYDEVVSDPNPDKKALIKIVKLRRHTSHIFYQAVQEKLESYEHTANTIEATMSPVQLYEVGNPLWTKDLSVNAIRGFLMLHGDANKENVNPHDYLEAYIADVRSGTSVSEAYSQQRPNLTTN